MSFERKYRLIQVSVWLGSLVALFLIAAVWWILLQQSSRAHPRYAVGYLVVSYLVYIVLCKRLSDQVLEAKHECKPVEPNQSQFVQDVQASLKISIPYNLQIVDTNRIAGAYGIRPNFAVVLSKRLVARFRKDELRFVIAHEVGHGQYHSSFVQFVFDSLYKGAIAGVTTVLLTMVLREGFTTELYRTTALAFVLCALVAPILNAKLSHLHEWGADTYALAVTHNSGAFAEFCMEHMNEADLCARLYNRPIVYEPQTKNHLFYLWQWLHYDHRPMTQRYRWGLVMEQAIQSQVASTSELKSWITKPPR